MWICPKCKTILCRSDFMINRIDKDIQNEIINFEKRHEIIRCENCKISLDF